MLFVAAYGSAAPATGAKRYSIRLNLTTGETYRLTATTTQTVEQSIFGMTMTMNQEASVEYRYAVVGVDEDGLTHLNVTYDSFVISMEIDSPMVSPEEREALNRQLVESLEESAGLIEGLTFAIEVTPFGEVVSIDGTNALAEMLFDRLPDGDAGQQVREILDGVTSPEYFIQSWESMFGYIPRRPVAIGDRWEQTLSLERGLEMELVTTFMLASVGEDEIVVEVEGSVASGGLSGGPMLQLESEDIVLDLALEGVQRGTVRVDPLTGWIVEQHLTIDADAVLSFSVDDQSLQVPMRLELESTVR